MKIQPYNNKENALTPLFRDENSITRLFVALCRNLKVRRVLIKAIFSNDLPDETIDNLEINEQVHLDSFRPDIEIYGDNFYALIEVKVSPSAPLQPTQPETYLEYILKNHDNIQKKYFILLTPEEYNLCEYERRKDKFKKKYPLAIININEITWTEVIFKLNQNDKIFENLYLSDFYHALCDYFIQPVVSFTQEQLTEENMFTKAAAGCLINMFNLIHGLNKKLSSNDFDVGFYDKKDWWNGEDYGVYLDLIDNKDCYFYFGFWMHFWKNYGSPISISINADADKKTTSAFKSTFANTLMIKGDSGRYSFLVSPITAEQLNEDSVENIYKMMLPFIEEHCIKLR